MSSNKLEKEYEEAMSNGYKYIDPDSCPISEDVEGFKDRYLEAYKAGLFDYLVLEYGLDELEALKIINEIKE